MTQEKVFISEADQYLFAQGTHYDIYKKLGAHLSTEDGVQGVYFGVWAPNAAQVNVIGTFNEWNEESHPMQKLGEGGIWGLFVPGVGEGTMYLCEGWQKAVQSRSFCQLCGIQTRNSVHRYGYHGIRLEGFQVDGSPG